MLLHSQCIYYECYYKSLLTPVQTSIAFVYATGGSELLIDAVCVDMVRRVVTPNDTLAGTAFGSNQKDTHDTITSIQHGT